MEYQKINLYFMGVDKYGLINSTLNNSVNFKGIINNVKDDLKKSNNELTMILFSEETASNFEDITCHFDKVILYDKFVNDMYNLAEQIYYSNYDYSYLINAIEDAKHNSTEGIFVGHSYSLNGIDDSRLKGNILNLSSSSQDIYYSIKIAKEVIEYNKNIKNCYFGTGYWSFYFDLSKSKNNEVQRIENIYYPIFKDSHNYEYPTPKDLIKISDYVDQLGSELFNLDKLYNYLSRNIYMSDKGYFNDKLSRKDLRLIKETSLKEIDEESKVILGRDRAEQHNKLINFIETKDENKALIGDFLKYLNSKCIQTYIINFPATQYYNKFLDKRFQEEYYKILKDLKKQCSFQLIDLNCSNYKFYDEDFRDFDHIGDLGVPKVCDILNNIIN